MSLSTKKQDGCDKDMRNKRDKAKLWPSILTNMRICQLPSPSLTTLRTAAQVQLYRIIFQSIRVYYRLDEGATTLSSVHAFQGELTTVTQNYSAAMFKSIASFPVSVASGQLL